MSIVWGIDISTTRVAFASTTGATASLDVPPKFQGAERLAVARELVRVFTVGFAETNPPLCVWIEQPTGKHPKPTLVQMTGVVSEAIYAALSTLYAHPVTVYPIAVKSWKKAVVGNGNATKEDVWEWARRAHLPTLGLRQLANQDEADALAIAFAGQSMIRQTPDAQRRAA